MSSSLSPCSSQGFCVAGYQVWFQVLEQSQKLNLNTHLPLSPREQWSSTLSFLETLKNGQFFIKGILFSEPTREAPERRDNLNSRVTYWQLKVFTRPHQLTLAQLLPTAERLAHTHKTWREAPALLSSRDCKQSGAQMGCYMKRQRTWYLLSLWTYLKRLDSPVRYFLGVTAPPWGPQLRLWQGTLT